MIITIAIEASEVAPMREETKQRPGGHSQRPSGHDRAVAEVASVEVLPHVEDLRGSDAGHQEERHEGHAHHEPQDRVVAEDLEAAADLVLFSFARGRSGADGAP